MSRIKKKKLFPEKLKSVHDTIKKNFFQFFSTSLCVFNQICSLDCLIVDSGGVVHSLNTSQGIIQDLFLLGGGGGGGGFL